MRHGALPVVIFLFCVGVVTSATASFERSYQQPTKTINTSEDAYSDPSEVADQNDYQHSPATVPNDIPSSDSRTPVAAEKSQLVPPMTSSALTPETPSTDTVPPVKTPVTPDMTASDVTSDRSTNYLRLKEVLPIYEDAVLHPWPTIPEPEGLLHVGTRSDIIPLIREHLKRTHDLDDVSVNNDHFDKTLAAAVKLYQWRHGLKPDGVIGEKTIAELNIPPEQRLQQIRLNIQRWEQLSDQLDDRYVMVNIPEYALHLVDHGKEVLNMKVIVGKPELPTPELSSTITRLVFNPPWNIPVRIARNDIIPKVLENPHYLDENNIRIFNSPEENAYEIDPQNLDWNNMIEDGSNYHFRQDPGQKNALGLVKFEFQNSHDVYLHDTPAKNLFSLDERDMSHGCIRLENPFSLVSYLIQNDVRLNDEVIGEILEQQKTRYVRIQHPIPIIITYITAWVDDNQILHFADDIYNHDEMPGQPAALAQSQPPIENPAVQAYMDN